MTVEIEFPIEFLVSGTPVSLQAKRRDSIKEWKEQVRNASSVVLPEGHFSSAAPMSVTLFYFPIAEMAGDIDNIVKPILDALCRHVYDDDRQVERIVVQKFEPGRVMQFNAPSTTLMDALLGERPILYVRLSDDPEKGLIQILAPQTRLLTAGLGAVTLFPVAANIRHRDREMSNRRTSGVGLRIEPGCRSETGRTCREARKLGPLGPRVVT